jgi:anti-sigma regulatory factor (Ser/Thr protein kinase)
MILTCQVSQARPRHERWRQEGIQSMSEIGRVLDRMVETLEADGYPRRDVFGIRLAVEEALVNAVKHGQRSDETRLDSLSHWYEGDPGRG